MKTITTSLLLFAFATAFAQVKLNDKDLKNLVAISEISFNDPNASGTDFDASLIKLRTPKLNSIIDVLVLMDGSNSNLLTPKYLNRPDNETLQLWYVISAINSNMQTDNKSPRPNEQVAKEVLAKKVDERWLLDNYYHEMYGGIAMLFNEKDLSTTNFDLNTYNLKNPTEKAIFFLNITKPLMQRFQVLTQMENPDKLMEYAVKMPKFNGKPYYTFTDFGYDDFDYNTSEGKVSYNKENIGQYYSSLMSHFMAVAQKKDTTLAKEIYFGSIMSKPEYFKFSDAESSLQQVYEGSKK